MKHYKESWYSFTFDVINSYDPYYEEPERLQSLDELYELIQKHDLFTDESITLEDVSAVRAYRDKIRHLIVDGSDTELGEFLTEFELRSPILPQLKPKGNGRFELVYEQQDSKKYSLTDRILAICSYVLGRELVEYGRSRVKVCASTPCHEVFIDKSKNGRRRFCCKRCSTRFHVKKHRQST